MKGKILGFALLILAIFCTSGWSFPAYWIYDYGTNLNLGDDDYSSYSLGFDFYFYGISYDTVYISSNGILTFGGGSSEWSSPDIPDPTIDLPIIAPLFGDFNPSNSGAVYANVLGSPGHRKFVATWYQIPEYSDGGQNTFQVVLYEGLNMIQFGYGRLDTDGLNWNGPTMDVGIDSNTGLYINSASGSAIPGLANSNIFYIPVDNTASNYYQSNAPIPEPTTVALLGLGIGSVVLLSYRQKSKK